MHAILNCTNVLVMQTAIVFFEKTEKEKKNHVSKMYWQEAINIHQLQS